MSDLYLHQYVFDTRTLFAFAREQGLLHRDLDEGYLIHAAFAALFDARAPTPFALEASLDSHEGNLGLESPSHVVLGYSDKPLEILAQHASISYRGLVRWERSASKAMPELEAGREIGFVTRVMPTVRSKVGQTPASTGERAHSREMDAFLAACLRNPESQFDRTVVYRDWIMRELSVAREGTAGVPAELTDFALRRFQRIRVLRKEQSKNEGRKRHSLERPDAVIAGALRITNADAFRTLLQRGLGRHRAFGFGMLLLRRV